ncbi:MAG: hypothetical protein DYG90_10710 [Chloroflexi bacterium CFX6]|nr:hypothetical protein [Chloroflexi bacterium CFX6]
MLPCEGAAPLAEGELQLRAHTRVLQPPLRQPLLHRLTIKRQITRARLARNGLFPKQPRQAPAERRGELSSLRERQFLQTAHPLLVRKGAEADKTITVASGDARAQQPQLGQGGQARDHRVLNVDLRLSTARRPCLSGRDQVLGLDSRRPEHARPRAQVVLDGLHCGQAEA